MSALPVPATAPLPAVLDVHGRDPESAPEKLRTRKGYAQLPYPLLADLCRLSRGNHSLLGLLIHIHCALYMRRRKAREKLPDWTEDLAIREWAALLSCKERQVYAVIAYGVTRKLFDVKRSAGGERAAFRLRVDTWQKLPDYQAFDDEETDAMGENADGAGEDAVSNDPASRPVRLLKTPVKVMPRGESRPLKIEQGVRSLRLVSADQSHQLVFDAVIVAGEVRVSAQAFSLEVQNSRPSVSNNLSDGSCSALHGDGGVPGGNGAGAPSRIPAQRLAKAPPARKVTERDRRVFEGMLRRMKLEVTEENVARMARGEI